jgi:integrase
MKLTAKSVVTLGLPAGRSDHVHYDDAVPGFGLRVRAGGSRTYVYRYRIGRRQRSISLGAVSAVPLARARTLAGELHAKVRLGGDPAADKQTARAEAGNTLGALIDQYIDSRTADWRPSSRRQVLRHLLRYAQPLHATPITAVTQRDIARLLDSIAKSSGSVTANRLRASLETLFAWVIGQGIRLPEGNPVSYTNKRRENSRARVLSDTELAAVWRACNDGTDHSSIVKLLMLTGCREAEIGGLRWDEVKDARPDLPHAQMQIELPGARTKNKRPHIVPLSSPAWAVLEPLRMAGRDYVFGRNDHSIGFKGWGVSRGRLEQRLRAADVAMPHWVLHDLRRSVASGMQRCGVRTEVIERVLNHVSGSFRGVAGVYQRDPLAADVRDALDRWAHHIMAIVEGRDATVVPMKRGA